MPLGLDVTPGYDWTATPNDPLDNAKLAATATPQVEIPDHSIGALQLVAEALSSSGASRNYVINGDFALTQRGSGNFVTLSPAGPYTTEEKKYLLASYDRWGVTKYNAGTILQRFSAANIVELPNSDWYMTWHQLSAVTVNPSFLATRIESVHTLQGQTATVSVTVRANAAMTLGLQLTQHFGALADSIKPSSDVDVAVQNIDVTDTWTRYSKVFSLPSTNGKTLGVDPTMGDWLELRIIAPQGRTFFLEFGEVSLTEGAVAPTFQRTEVEIEPMRAMRYFEVIWSRLASSLTTFTPIIFYKVHKRYQATPGTVFIAGDLSTPYATYYTALDTGSAYQSAAHALASTKSWVDAEMRRDTIDFI